MSQPPFPLPSSTHGHTHTLSTKEISTRYIYQITFGCNSINCNNPYCSKNISKSLFFGKKVTPTAIPSLACHLTSSRGDKALCEELKLHELPYDIKDKIDYNNPFKIRNSSNNKKSKSTNGLPYLLTSSISFSNWCNEPVESSLKIALKSYNIKSFLDNYLIKSLLHGINNEFVPLDVNQFLLSFRNLGNSQFPFPLIRCLCHILTPIRNKLSLELKFSSSDSIRIQLSLIDTFLSILVGITPPINRSLLTLPLPIELLSLKLDSIPNYSHPYISTSIKSYLTLWPQGSSISILKHFDEINTFISLNPDIELPIFSNFRIPSSAFFRFYSSLEYNEDNGWKTPLLASNKSPIYITNISGILTPIQRLSIFRLACLKKMNSTLIRLKNVTSGLDEHRYYLKDEPDSLSLYFTPALVDINVFVLDIDRNNFLDSTIDCISKALLVENLIRRPIKVRFGLTEIAIDQGGVQIEFFQELGTHLVFSNYGLFKYDEDSRLTWFNPGFTGDAKVYEYIGILFALALYNGCMIDIGFPSMFYEILLKASLNLPLSIESLRNIVLPSKSSFLSHQFWGLYPFHTKSFEDMLNSDPKSIDELDLDFTYEYSLDTGEIHTDKLPSYSNGRVTHNNILQFVDEFTNHVLYDSIDEFLLNFIQGFCFVLNGQIINLITASQLQSMIEGSPIINIDELKAVTRYDGFLSTSSTIKYFWSVLRGFNEIQKGQLLEFVTGSKRIPVGGVKQLDFVIQRNGTDSSRIPSSSVCFSRLLIPEFKSEKQLKKMLLLAIEHSKGFGLI